MEDTRVVVAQELANFLRGSGECYGAGELWHSAESAHGEAKNTRAALRAAAPVEAICHTCPVRRVCMGWAALDRYDGFAGGLWWYDGEPHEPGWVRKRRDRRTKKPVMGTVA